MNARIAVNQPVNANLNAGSASTVFERIDPVELGFCLIYTHAMSVAHGLLMSNYLQDVASNALMFNRAQFFCEFRAFAFSSNASALVRSISSLEKFSFLSRSNASGFRSQ